MVSGRHILQKTPRSGSVATEPPWVSLSDQELLDWRICDLRVQIKGSRLEQRIGRLYKELTQRGIRFRPHCWLSDDWFSPDGVPGIAIPFYMAHPRLARLERNQMLEVEGGNESWCMRILRHEAGHAIDTAYRLHRRKRWQNTFGKASQPYPEYYQPKPHSRSYVHHLEAWYAQSHPAEDFAETFAVWLKPRSNWRLQYRRWPALKKLEYVDLAMAELQAKKPAVRSREHTDSLGKLRKTLREHYAEKSDRYGIGYESYYDRELRKLFSDTVEHSNRKAAASFLRHVRSDLRRSVAEWTGQYQYTIDQILSEMIERCRELDLRLDRSESRTRRAAETMLTVQTMNVLHHGHHKVAV